MASSSSKQETSMQIATEEWRWEKPQEGGVGVELCFQKHLFLTFWRTVPRFRVWSSSESECVQSLGAADNE